MEAKSDRVEGHCNFNIEIQDTNTAATADGVHIEMSALNGSVATATATADAAADIHIAVGSTGDVAEDVACNNTVEDTAELVSADVVSAYKKEQFNERGLFGTYGTACAVVLYAMFVSLGFGLVVALMSLIRNATLPSFLHGDAVNKTANETTIEILDYWGDLSWTTGILWDVHYSFYCN